MQIRLVLRMISFLRLVWPTALIAGTVVIVRIVLEVTSVYFISPMVSSLSRTRDGTPPHDFLQWLFDTTPNAHQNAQEMRSLLIWMGLTQFGLVAAIYLRNVWDTRLSMDAVFHMRSAIYDRLQNAQFSFHDRMTSGQLINRALTDLQAVRNFVNLSLIGSLDTIGSISAYLTLLYFRSAWLMFAALIPIPFWIVLIRRFSQRAQTIYHSQQEASDDLMAALTQNISGVHVIKAFGTESQEMDKYNRLNAKLLNRISDLIQLQSQLTPAMKGFTSVTHIALFVLTVGLIRQGAMHVGDLMILGLAMGAILNKLQNINMMAEAYQKAAVSSRRIFEILDAPHIHSTDSSNSIQIVQGQIEFENVSFSYDEKTPALRDITISIPGNKVTALVGPIASGKSTLTYLISRFYDPQVGKVKIDGQDLRFVSLKELRRVVGYVFQEPFLFSDTVRNNIRYGRKDVSNEMLYQAAIAAHADEFIKCLPLGYDTLLGEGGVQLSGGQRQRLALARALVYDPKILILDDATAALDVKTEHTIQKNLDPLFNNRTVIIISNRIRTIRSADYVLVMENGSITQGGIHSELLKMSGHYSEILRLQLQPAHTQPAFAETGVVH